jgi:peptidyl-tRNA hydrolase
VTPACRATSGSNGIPTALGIGPADRSRIKPIVCKLKLSAPV